LLILSDVKTAFQLLLLFFDCNMFTLLFIPYALVNNCL
jgi:hypothetical protein